MISGGMAILPEPEGYQKPGFKTPPARAAFWFEPFSSRAPAGREASRFKVQDSKTPDQGLALGGHLCYDVIGFKSWAESSTCKSGIATDSIQVRPSGWH